MHVNHTMVGQPCSAAHFIHWVRDTRRARHAPRVADGCACWTVVGAGLRNATLTDKAADLESGAKRLQHRVKELENERDRLMSRVQVLDLHCNEAQQSLASAEQSAAAKLLLLQQEKQGGVGCSCTAAGRRRGGAAEAAGGCEPSSSV